MADSWNSVQIVTLVVEALTPITVVVLGVLFARASNKASQRIQDAQWANQTVVTHRLKIYDKLAPGLNQLFCFATFVGSWKEIDPPKAIALKRDLDQTMYANRVLFSDELFSAYDAFMSSLFAMFAATDADAPLLAPIAHALGDRRKLPWWSERMNSLFSTDPNEISKIQAAYHALGEQFRVDLYITHQARPMLITK